MEITDLGRMGQGTRARLPTGLTRFIALRGLEI